MDAGVSALAVARTKVVAEPRFAPDGARLGWLEATDGRTELVVAPVDGSGPPRDCHRRPDPRRGRRVPGRDVVLGRRRPGRGRDPGRRRSWWCRSPAEPRRSSPATAAPPRPRPRPDGRILFACERDDALDVAETWADARAWPQRWSRRRLRVGPGDLRRRPLGRVARVGPDADVVDRVADRARGPPRRRRRGSSPADPRVSVGQPRFSPDGRMLAYVSDETGWWNVHVAAADGTGARPLLVEPHDHAEPAWGPGQRSFAWSPDVGRDRARAATRTASRGSSSSGSTARSPRSRGDGTTASTGDRPGSSRCARARARHRRSRSPIRPAARDAWSRAARPAGIETAPASRRSSRGRRATTTISGLLYRPDAETARRPAPARRPARWPDRPGRRPVGRMAALLHESRVRGAAAEPPRLHRVRAGRSCRTTPARWGDADVADVAAGIEAAGPGRLGRSGPGGGGRAGAPAA